MKKNFVLFVFSISGLLGHAENILQIVPQRIERGSTSDDERTFSIELVNEEEFCALEFDLYLPEGMELDDIDPIVMSKDRFPYTEGRTGIKFDHTVDFSKRPDGFYRVQVGFTGADKVNSKISGNSGELFTIYYVTSEDLPDGILPVKIDNVTFAISGTQGIYPPTASGYFYAGDFDPSTVTSLDLSGLTGYMPSDVVNATNDLISTNTDLSEIRLDNLSDMGEKIAPSNPNCLIYMAQDSDALNQGVDSGNAISIGDDGIKASTVALVDGNDFNCPYAIACPDIEYSRAFSTNDWQALFLPFEISYADWAPLGKVAKLSDVREISGKDMLLWEVITEGVIPANTPCLFKPTDVGSLSLIASSGELLPDTKANDISYSSTSGNTYTISGTYVKKQDMAPSETYVLYEDNFHPADDTAILLPFRIYINIEGANLSACTPCLNNIFQDGTSLIDAIETDKDIETKIFDINGRPISQSIHGLYIMRNCKIIIK